MRDGRIDGTTKDRHGRTVFRPSTDPAPAPEDVDTRDKHGHDERGLRSGCNCATAFREPDSRGLVPGIHGNRQDLCRVVDGRDEPGRARP
jgi:hypothetical protein